MAKVVAFCSPCRNSGKTTLLLKLLECFKQRGIRTSVLKGCHHIQVDESKDSRRFAAAGAEASLLVTGQGWILESRTQGETPLERAIELLLAFGDCEVILVEGYKLANIGKIAVCRSDVSMELPCPKEELLAVASDLRVEIGLPCFDLDHDIEAICDFILSLEC